MVRHGRVACPPPATWIDAAGVERWLAAYDAAGLHDSDAPPARLVRAASAAHHVLASDLPARWRRRSGWRRAGR